MNNARTSDPIQTMFSNLTHIRKYAARVLVDHEVLTDEEVQDKSTRMTEYLQTGESLNWTPKEMVSLVLREVFATSGR